MNSNRVAAANRELTEQLVQKVMSAGRTFDAYMAERNRVISALNREIDKGNEIITSLYDQIDESNEEYNGLVDQIDELKGELSKTVAVSNKTKGQLVELEGRLKDSEKNLALTRDENCNVTRELSVMSQRKEYVTKDLSRSEEKCAALQRELAAYKRILQTNHSEIATEAEFECWYEDFCDQCNSELEQLI